jgi:hypothetical protein
MRNNQKGFSAVETILVLTVIILIAVVGWLVYKVEHKTTTQATGSSVTTPTAQSPYAGWKTYSDSSFSLKYPVNWKTVAPGDREGSIVDVDSPRADQSYFSLKTDALSKPYVGLSLFNSIGQPSSCGTAFICTITAVAPLTTTGIAHPILATISEVSTDPSASKITLFEILDSNTTKVGDNKFSEGVTVNGKTYQFIGAIVYTAGNSYSADYAEASVNNLDAFQKSADYQNLVTVADSLIVK